MYNIVLFMIISWSITLYAQQKIYSYDENFKPKKFDQAEFNSSTLTNNKTHIHDQQGYWSKDFSIPGISGRIYTSVTDGSNLYIGGQFNAAGSSIANNIARWDGQNWASVGVGAENGTHQRNVSDVPAVHAMAWWQGKLFIGGQFPLAGSHEANGIAFWDGLQWNSLGTGETNGLKRYIIIDGDTTIARGFVWSLFVQKDKLYVGGHFHLAGGKPANGLAVWDLINGEWQSLNGGLAGTYPNEPVYAYAFASNGDDLYIGGKFFKIGGVEAQHIARWDGSEFTSLGNAEGFIYDLKFDSNNNLFAVGFYTENVINGTSNVGIWDGQNWSALSGPAGFNTIIDRMLFSNNTLFISGYIESPETYPGYSFARWDGHNWTMIPGLGLAVNEFFTGNPGAMQIINDKLYLAGDFNIAGDIYVVNVVEWDMLSGQYKKLDDGNKNQGIYDGYIAALEQKGDVLYAGGSFNIAGDVYTRNIAKWTGEYWESLGTGYGNGIRGTVLTILADGDDVYAGGHFGSAGTWEAYHIAHWDGSQWAALGIGVGGVTGAQVNALAKVDDYLYVAGYFSIVGDEETYAQPANSIARFNLLTRRWETLGQGIEYVAGIPGIVYDLEVYQDKIYVAGDFQSAGGMSFYNFAVLTNNKWSGIGDNTEIGIEGSVAVVKVIQDEIYIGGVVRLDRYGDSYGLLKWHEKEWIPVGDRLTAEKDQVFLYDIEPFEDGFIIGGYFKNAGEMEVNNIAYFNGAEWYNLGAGILPGVSEISLFNNSVYICGPDVIRSDQTVSYGLAKYTSDITSITDDYVKPGQFVLLQNYPNPFNPVTIIPYIIEKSAPVSIKVYNSAGQEVARLVDAFKSVGSYTQVFDASHLTSGVYYYQLQTADHIETRKCILLK